MKLGKIVNELGLKFEIIATGFWELNARWKGCYNGIELTIQRWWLSHNWI